MEIEEIVRRAAAGDEWAWAELVLRHRRLLRSLGAGLRLRSSDVEDAAQQTWLALRESIHGLHSPEHVRAWLCRVMRRNCVRILVAQRSEWLDQDIETRTERAADPDAIERVVRAEVAAQLWSAVDRLPERERALVRALFDNAERSYKEIAHELAMPIGAIGPVRMRALKRLPGLLAEVGVTVADLDAVA